MPTAHIKPKTIIINFFIFSTTLSPALSYKL